MKMDVSEFRRVIGHFATGVTVVASRDRERDEPRALTANAVASVSLDPMLVLVCVEVDADTHDALLDAGIFCINILAAGQEPLARRFAWEESQAKFDGIAYREEVTGAPVLEDVLAWVDCRVWATYPGGDHTIVVGEVEAGGARPGVPLVYHRSGYTRLRP